jgi:hypothetical protein
LQETELSFAREAAGQDVQKEIQMNSVAAKVVGLARLLSA